MIHSLPSEWAKESSRGFLLVRVDIEGQRVKVDVCVRV